MQCRAVRCDPRPSMMTDLSIQTANSGKVSYTVVEEMERALAAGERQALLQPDDGWVSSGLLGLGEWVAGCVWGLGVVGGGGGAALMLGAGPWMGCTSSTEAEVTPFRPCSQQQGWLAEVQCWPRVCRYTRKRLSQKALPAASAKVNAWCRDVHMRVVLLLYFTSRYEDALAWLDRHKPVILAAHGMDIPFFDFCDRLQFICDQQRLAARGDTLADIE